MLISRRARNDRSPREWSKHNCVTLIDNFASRGEEDTARLLEMQKFEVYADRDLDRIEYSLMIGVDDNDLTIGPLTARQICEIAENMIRLVGGTLQARVEPPDDPEIRF